MNASPNPPAPEALAAIIARARESDGQPPFSDQSLVELERGERSLVRTDHGAAVVGADDVELVVDPDARGRGEGTALLERVLAEHPEVRFAWAHGDHPASRALAARFDFVAVRTLLQLRAAVPDGDSLRDALRAPQGTGPLPEEPATPASRREHPEDHQLRSFRPGTDDAAWLALNSRAFAHHPEQGNLTHRDLDDRVAEPWFDADDFLILTDDGAMTGFCWLKIAGNADSANARVDVGEFYAVGIDPDRQGEGLGRVLMDAGFARLAERGIRTAALYVEADNEPALALYERYGFTRYTIDVRYHRPAN